jgi:hypothetical protein
MFGGDRRSRDAIVAALAFGVLHAVPVSAADSLDLARQLAFVRCAGDRLLACSVGANLNCGKADTRRSLPGAREYCRANPDADNIPMVATGHATIYAWRCVGRSAVATKAVVAVDPHGYDAGNWKEVGR